MGRLFVEGMSVAPVSIRVGSALGGFVDLSRRWGNLSGGPGQLEYRYSDLRWLAALFRLVRIWRAKDQKQTYFWSDEFNANAMRAARTHENQ